MSLKECCRQEAADSLEGHRDVATCDGCGNLLLAYEDQQTFDLTVQELESRGAGFATGEETGLRVVSKER